MKRNWKTTLASVVMSAGFGLQDNSDELIATIGKLMTIVGSILVGYFAKDYNVTGGTQAQ